MDAQITGDRAEVRVGPAICGRRFARCRRGGARHPRQCRTLSVAVKKGAILAPLAPRLSAAFWNEPFSPPRRCSSERTGAVKGAPLLGAAKRTLDGEDRSARLEGERKARRRTNERWGKKMAPSLGATDTREQAGRSIPPKGEGRTKTVGAFYP